MGISSPAFAYVNMNVESDYERLIQNYIVVKLLGKVLVYMVPMSSMVNKCNKKRNPDVAAWQSSGEESRGPWQSWK